MPTTTPEIAFTASTPLAFADAVARCRAELAREGFGVLTEIDIQAKLREKLGVERAPYLILGACHPPSADRVLQAAPEFGVLLPCNVTVSLEHGATVVRAMNPAAAVPLAGDAGGVVAEVAASVGAALERVVKAVAAG